MSEVMIIHIALLGEGINVWRPVQAQHLQADVYRILSQPYDRATESWQFEPGDDVLCKMIESSNGRILAAIKKAN